MLVTCGKESLKTGYMQGEARRIGCRQQEIEKGHKKVRLGMQKLRRGLRVVSHFLCY